MIGRILVVLSGTPYAETATRTAIELAERRNAEITGVTLVNTAHLRNVGPVPIGASTLADELRHHRETMTHSLVDECVDHFRAECDKARIRYGVLHEERDRPFDYVISQARYHDLVLFGLRGIFEFGMTGEVDYEPSLVLIRLLTEGVRPIIAVNRQYRSVRRVFIAYSGSIASAKTMKLFMQLRLWTDMEICITTFGDDTDRCHRLLSHAAEYCRAHGALPETRHIAEDPKHHLLAAAQEWNADLIVMGNSERTLMLRRMLGETMLQTVRTADRPLFLSQ